MKKILSTLLIAASALALTSCGGDDGGGDGPNTYNITVSVTGGTGGSAVATVDGATVTKVAAGTTVTLTATPADGYEFTGWTVTASGAHLSSATSANTTFNMPEANVSIEAAFAEGVTINGVTWATRNVDAPGTFAAKPEDYGMFYQWNRKKGWPATGNVTGWDNTAATGDSWAEVNDPCPAGWRVPTIEERTKLVFTENVSNEWTTLNSVNGCKFTDKTSGKSIFLPAAGYHAGGDTANAGTSGRYWTSSTQGSPYGYFIQFNEYTASGDSQSRVLALPVRCVKKD